MTGCVIFHILGFALLERQEIITFNDSVYQIINNDGVYRAALALPLSSHNWQTVYQRILNLRHDDDVTVKIINLC